MTRPSNRIRASQLRKQATGAETLLWRYLRRRQLGGHHFRRQHRIGPYFVDFACRQSKLVIELDGSQHQDQQQYDRRRDAYIRRKGFKIIRLGNEEVFGDIDAVLNAISQTLERPSGGGTGAPPTRRPRTPQGAGRTWT